MSLYLGEGGCLVSCLPWYWRLKSNLIGMYSKPSAPATPYESYGMRSKLASSKRRQWYLSDPMPAASGCPLTGPMECEISISQVLAGHIATEAYLWIYWGIQCWPLFSQFRITLSLSKNNKSTESATFVAGLDTKVKYICSIDWNVSIILNIEKNCPILVPNSLIPLSQKPFTCTWMKT